MIENDKKGEAIYFPAPMVIVVVILIADAFNDWMPLGLGLPAYFVHVATFIMVFSVVILIHSAVLFKKSKTNVQPWLPTFYIISSGMYRYSRNPIYVAFCFIQVGAAILLNNFWMFVGVFISAFLIFHIAIKKEEKYLENKFKEEYLEYRNKVRRWF